MARRRRAEEPNLFGIRCGECGRQLTRTQSGYLACPLGHGKLRVDDEAPEEPERCGSWFDPDGPEAA